MATSDDAREQRLEAARQRLTGAVQALVSGEDWIRAMAFAAKFRTRSFGNTLLIWVQHADAFARGRVSVAEPSFVAGYRQWQGLGRQVDKGQAGYVILAPVLGRFATSMPADAASWRRLGRGEKPRPGEVVASKMIATKTTHVWDVSQTSGDPIPQVPAPVLLAGRAPAGLWDGLAMVTEQQGYRLELVPDAQAIGGANGRTDFVARSVVVRADMDEAARVKTLAHELGHVLLHDPNSRARSQDRGVGEVEAESVALMIGAAHGMDTTGYTIPYVAGWAARVEGQEPVQVVAATGERVRRAALYIVDGLDTVQVGGGDPPGLARQHGASTAIRFPRVDAAGAHVGAPGFAVPEPSAPDLRQGL